MRIFERFVFPFVYLSLKEATSTSGISKWDWLIFIPSVIFHSIGERVATDIFLCIQVIAVLAVSTFEVQRYKKLSAEYYDTDDAAELPGQVLLLLIASTVIAAVMIFLPADIRFYKPITVMLTLFLTAVLYLLGVNVSKFGQQPQLPDEPLSVAEGEQAPAQVTGSEADRIPLQKVMDEKLFLDPTLSLISLAKKLHTNRTYLSNSIHSCYNQNFSDFINHLRIGHAIDLMKEEGSRANIKDIAIRSGYSHLQSFYRNFTQIMNMTPKTWMSQHKQNTSEDELDIVFAAHNPLQIPAPPCFKHHNILHPFRSVALCLQSGPREQPGRAYGPDGHCRSAAAVPFHTAFCIRRQTDIQMDGPQHKRGYTDALCHTQRTFLIDQGGTVLARGQGAVQARMFF